jgi:hypothetical protein
VDRTTAGPVGPRTLKRLEAITEGVRARSGVSVEPMQLAALLLEKTTEQLNDDDVRDLVTGQRRASRCLRANAHASGCHRHSSSGRRWTMFTNPKMFTIRELVSG